MQTSNKKENNKQNTDPGEIKICSVRSLSHVRLFTTPWTTACHASLSITNSRNLLKLMPIESVMPSNHLSSVIPFSSCPQFSPVSGSFQMSQLFASGGRSFNFNISPANEHSGLISFRLDWLDLLTVQGTLKSPLHSSKTSMLSFFL